MKFPKPFLSNIFRNLVPLRAALLWAAFSLSSAQAQTFREMGRQMGIDHYCLDQHSIAGGVVLFDYNQDNFPDLFLSGGERSNRLYRNNWNGTFTDISQESGIALANVNTVGAVAGDIDNDGDDDLLITTTEAHANVLLENKGDGTFQDISERAGLVQKAWSTSATFGDINLDGLLDIYISNYAVYTDLPFEKHITHCSPNFLYLNQGGNRFVEVAAEWGVADIGCGLAVTFTDCDNDRDPDLYVANDFGYIYEPNELYVNNYPAPGFQKTIGSSPIRARINSMGIAIGDLDEDGDCDYYVTNMRENLFFENLDRGSYFFEAAAWKGIQNPDGTSWGTAFLDIDQDTYLDLVVANGEILEGTHQNQRNRLYLGGNEPVFTPFSEEAGLANPANSRGLSFGDLDQDGDLDLIFGVVSRESGLEERTLVYQNNGEEAGHWLKVKLEGVEQNRNGYGSRIYAVIGDRKLMREADGGSSYLSHHFNEIHFGLGSHQQIDSLIVDWPGGYRQILTDIEAGQAIAVVEGSHWYAYRNEEIQIFAGEQIFLAGEYRSAAGVYHHMLTDRDGQDSLLIVIRLLVEEQPILPGEAVEMRAYPNPFSSELHVQLSLPEAGPVNLQISDAIGRTLQILADQELPPGKQELTCSIPPDWGKGLFLIRLEMNGHYHYYKVLRL